MVGLVQVWKEELILLFLTGLFLAVMFFILPNMTSCPYFHLDFRPWEKREKCNDYKMVYGCVGDKFDKDLNFLYNDLGYRNSCGYFIAQTNFENIILGVKDFNEKKKETVLVFSLVIIVGVSSAVIMRI